jgi:glucosylglycerol 3-phosphatase
LQRSADQKPHHLKSQRFSSDHKLLLNSLSRHKRVLFIQDLDGVCMDLVCDPLTRSLSPKYIHAAKQMAGHFFVLTNGEHTKKRGVNNLVDKALGSAEAAARDGLYLPGLAGGGVQWQNAAGQVSLPGVSETELVFLGSVPNRFRMELTQLLSMSPFSFDPATIQQLLAVIVLDNQVSPTININGAINLLGGRWETYRQLQQMVSTLLESVLSEAASQGLSDSFFIHYAPNLGSYAAGERVKWAIASDWGTSDFQFMIKGAVKEVGVLYILNQYYYQQTGEYPLGENFSFRTSPLDHAAILSLAQEALDPVLMPCIIGIGDTVTSMPDPDNQGNCLRGGSDRGFLSLVQALSMEQPFDSAVVFVDSSGGELSRPSVDAPQIAQAKAFPWSAVKGISDPEDPLLVNFVFADGHQQYVDFFCSLAKTYRPQANVVTDTRQDRFDAKL